MNALSICWKLKFVNMTLPSSVFNPRKDTYFFPFELANMTKLLVCVTNFSRPELSTCQNCSYIRSNNH